MSEIQEYDRVIVVNNIEALWYERKVLSKKAEEKHIDAIIAIWKSNENGGMESSNWRIRQTEIMIWLEQLPIISIICLEGSYEVKDFVFIMSFDIRIGASNTRFIVNESVSQLLEEKCRNAIGEGYKGWKLEVGQVLDLCRLMESNLVSIENDIQDTEKIVAYIQQLIAGKSSLQIQELKACFKLYKQIDRKLDRRILLRREAEAFCKLVIEGEN